MKQMLLKLKAVMVLGLCLGISHLQGQSYLNVNTNSGVQNAYTLSAIRKQTFSGTGNMSITTNTGSTDTYALSSVRNLNFSDLSTAASPNVSQNSNVQLYPNPVQDVLNFHLSEASSPTASIEVLTIEGRVLVAQLLSGYCGIFHMNVSALKPGIYLCRIKNGTCIETTKFFKQ